LNLSLQAIIDDNDDENIEITKLHEHCRNVFPERFFDILYQNEQMFNDETENNEESKNVNVEFLPGIDFKVLWRENISDKTRETIWKYLQLILFTTVSNISDGDSFGDTAKLFEAINEDEFRAKLEDTITQMQSIFEGAGAGAGGEGAGGEGAGGEGAGGEGAGAGAGEGGEGGEGEGGEDGEGKRSGINLDDLPDPNTIHEHITGMMDGKLGNLAREIAEETAQDLNMDMENASSINDVFQKLFKNPTKLIGLVKNIGSKLDAKIKSGDIKESELLAEATDIVKKMKDMPGMSNLQGMLGKMGMGRGKVNTAAMQSHLNRNMKMAKQKERMRAKADDKHKENTQIDPEVFKNQQAAAAAAAADLLRSEGFTEDGIENLVFSTGETYQKSVRSQETPKKKKKKNKKKKEKSNK
jgi:hypothetical protein